MWRLFYHTIEKRICQNGRPASSFDSHLEYKAEMKSLRNHLQYAADEMMIELSDSQHTIETEILSSRRRENDN